MSTSSVAMRCSLNNGALRVYTRVDDDWVMHLDDGKVWKMSVNLVRDQTDMCPEIAQACNGDWLVYRSRAKPIWVQNTLKSQTKSVYCLVEKNHWQHLVGSDDPSVRLRIERMEKRGFQCPLFSLIVSNGVDFDLLLYEPRMESVSLSVYEQPSVGPEPVIKVITKTSPLLHWVLLVLVIICSGFTWASLESTERFHTVRSFIDMQDNFSSDAHWVSRGSALVSYLEGGVNLISAEDGQGKPRWTNHTITRVFRLEAGFYRISVESSSSGITALDQPVWGAHTGMTLFDSDDNRIGRFPLSNQTGDSELTKYEKVVEVTEATPIVRYQVRFMANSGSMYAQNPALYQLEQTKTYNFVKFGLLFIWSSLLLLMGYVVVRCLLDHSSRLKVWIAAAALLTVAGIAAALMLLPAQVTSAIEDLDFVSALDSHFVYNYNYEDIVSASSHFLLFAIVGFLAGLYHRSVNFFFLLLVVFAFALFTESIQAFSLDRTPSVSDIGVDLMGGFFGFSLSCILVAVRFATVRFFYREVLKHKSYSEENNRSCLK